MGSAARGPPIVVKDEQGGIQCGGRAVIDQVVRSHEAVGGYVVTRQNFTGARKHLIMDVSPPRGMDKRLIRAFVFMNDLTPMQEQQERVAALNNHIRLSANKQQEISGHLPNLSSA